MAVQTITKSVGTSSRNYSTLQNWADGAPSNLTTAEKSSAGTFAVAAFQQGESLSFVGSGATGKFLYTDSTGVGTGTYVIYGITAGNPASGDVVTGGTSGATCILSSSTPTDVGIIWRGECYHDAGASDDFTAKLLISGLTTSSTCYPELTTATGQSFQDSANVRTNRLDYIASNGACQAYSATYNTAIDISVNYFRLSKLQIKANENGTNAITISGVSNTIIKDCIIRGNSSGINNNGSSAIIANIASITLKVNTSGISASNSDKLIGCTILQTNTGGTGIPGLHYPSSNSIIQSCAVFGFANATSWSSFDTTNSKNNATDLASGLPGVNNQHSVTYTSTTPLTQSSSTNTDLRAVSSTALASNGFLDSTNAPNDISGTARSATPTIGAWELASASNPAFPGSYIFPGIGF